MLAVEKQTRKNQHHKSPRMCILLKVCAYRVGCRGQNKFVVVQLNYYCISLPVCRCATLSDSVTVILDSVLLTVRSQEAEAVAIATQLRHIRHVSAPTVCL